MPDREKVIKALECCLKESDHLYSNPCNDCPYRGKECIDRMKTDALELLKEQEPIKPKSKVRHGANSQIQHWCGNCMVMLHGKPKFCPNCGKAVKWE